MPPDPAAAPAVTPAPAPAADPAAAAAATAATVYDNTPAPAADPAAAPAAASPVDPAADPAKPADPATPAPDAAPDYSTLALPEGVQADDPLLAAFTAVASEHKLAPDVAQSVVDAVAKAMPALAEQFQSMQAEAFKAKLAGWEAEVRADPEIGGAKLDAALNVIGAAMSRYGDANAIKAAMDETGAGNHPALVKFMHKMSLALSEASPVNGARPIAPKRSAAERMYDNTSGSKAA